MKEIPAISVIIPLYNVEKYIGECLDSILAQTFQNFEVIVVDDCSTDNSPAIVESYEPKFKGRLRLTRTKRNSGGAGFPRNKGMEFSCGEYLYFLDSDDTITPTALEELYTSAKKFNADVVHCEKYYNVPNIFWDNVEFRKNLKPSNYLTGEIINYPEPVLLGEDIENRVKIFSQRKLIWNLFMQLVRRDFVIDNEIRFNKAYGEDLFFTICEVCCAKRYFVIPNVIYFYRTGRANSFSNNMSIQKMIHKLVNALTSGIKHLDDFLADNEFFVRRPDLKYILMNVFVEQLLSELNSVYAQMPAHAIDELLRKEFGADSAFEIFFFNMMNIKRLQLMQMQNQFNRFAVQAQQRIAQLENELKLIKQQ